MKRVRFIYHIVLSLVVGIVGVLWLLQYNQQIRTWAEEQLKKSFEQSFDCILDVKLKKINLFSPTIEAENVLVKGRAHDTWFWKAKKFSVRASWLHLLFHRTIGLKIVLDTVQAESIIVDGSIAIADHLRTMLESQTDVPVVLNQLIIRKGSLMLHDADDHIRGTFLFSSEMKARQGHVKTTARLLDGSFVMNQRTLISGLDAGFSLDVTTMHGKASYFLNADGRMILDQLPPESRECHLVARWDDNQGSITFRNHDNSCVLEQGSVKSISDGLQGNFYLTFPVDFINKFACFISPDNIVKGSCKAFITAKSSSKNTTMHATLDCNDVRYQDTNFGSLAVQMQYDTGILHTTIDKIHDKGGSLQATVTWDHNQGTGLLDLHNTSTLQLTALPQFVVLPDDCMIHAHMNKSGDINGSYRCAVTDIRINAALTTQGTFSSCTDELDINGSMHENTYHALINLKQPWLSMVRVNDAKGIQRMLLKQNSGDSSLSEGIVDYTLLRSILSWLDIDIQGEGTLNVTTKLQDKKISGTLTMKDGNIRIPHTYNFMRTLAFDFEGDWSHRNLIITNASFGLHQGSIEAKRITMWWDDAFGLSYLHMPCVLDNVFLNVEKDIFFVVGGTITVLKHGTKEPLVKGSLLIERGQLKKNIFSYAFSKHLIHAFTTPRHSMFDVSMDLAIHTKKPIHVETSFLETDIKLGMMLKGSTNNPLLSGVLTLMNGSLGFPYRPLYITSGKLYFLPHQLYDPSLELVAKGRVKKYQVTLRASGSIQHPHISFESTPPLTEEQIITLLLAGSEEGSITLMMPSLIIQNIQNIIFGPEQSPSRLEGYFKNLLAPLKHIRIVPNFSDQTARGGFRGAIEIDVTDRLHGLIQKNFSLTEDTKFELEYVLSDDITARAIKDERGDLGGEVEMRWKF